MPSSLLTLPHELVQQIAKDLNYDDIWQLGTVSRQARHISLELLLTKYSIQLIRPVIQDPFAPIIHGAVACLMRHPHSTISVARRLCVALDQRTDSLSLLEFLLDTILDILIHATTFDTNNDLYINTLATCLYHLNTNLLYQFTIVPPLRRLLITTLVNQPTHHVDRTTTLLCRLVETNVVTIVEARLYADQVIMPLIPDHMLCLCNVVKACQPLKQSNDMPHLVHLTTLLQQAFTTYYQSKRPSTTLTLL
ncbi:hypothetical protein BC941DRAFT_476698 [Chlamydoabsidia padenii]|nr:hypothetical protein BC941DRAFT_476698 [Chlamydoabsidia padenii]